MGYLQEANFDGGNDSENTGYPSFWTKPLHFMVHCSKNGMVKPIDSYFGLKSAYLVCFCWTLADVKSIENWKL